MSTSLHSHITCVWGDIPIGLGTWIVTLKPAVEVCQTCSECLNHFHYVHHTGLSILISWLPHSPISPVIPWSFWPLIPSIIQCSQLITIRSGVSLNSTMMEKMVRSWTSLWVWRWSPFGFRPDCWLVARLIQHSLVSHILIFLHICFLNSGDNWFVLGPLCDFGGDLPLASGLIVDWLRGLFNTR